MTGSSAFSCKRQVSNSGSFESRFGHVPELLRMGARIRLQGSTAVVEGVEALVGARVHATDLRAGAALVVAGLAARGTTVVTGVHHIDRGYPHFCRRLAALGARIARVPASEPTPAALSL